MTSKLLMFPWHLGMGHLGRLREYGRQIVSLGLGSVSIAPREVSSVIPRLQQSPQASESKYVVVPGLDSAWSQAGFYNAKRLGRSVERCIAQIREYNPTHVVTHMHPGAVLAARMCGLPVISIADGDFLTSDEWGWMPWMSHSRLRRPPFPSSLPAIQSFCDSHDLDLVTQVSDLMWGNQTLIPSASDIDVAPHSGSAHPVYCGPLVWSDNSEFHMPIDYAGRYKALPVCGQRRFVAERCRGYSE